MKAAYFQEHGGVDVLQFGDLPPPPVGPGEVRIQVKACALNRLDLFVREGWKGIRLPLPHVGGTDLAGVVTQIGPDVDDVSLGDEVLVNPGLNFATGPDGDQIIPPAPSVVGETRWGGLATECVVPATHVLPKPPGWSWEEAAAFPLTALTVMQMLRRGDVGEGTRLLVVGAGGGIGVMAVQLAEALGAWVCATTGGAAKAEKIQALGADRVIDYKADADWWKSAFYATDKQGFDVVLDSVGAATWKFSLRCVKPGGSLLTCGATTGPIGETDIRQVFWKQLRIIGSSMGTQEDLARALDLAVGGTVRPIVDKVFSLEDIAAAHQYLASGQAFGKVVVLPPQE